MKKLTLTFCAWVALTLTACNKTPTPCNCFTVLDCLNAEGYTCDNDESPACDEKADRSYGDGLCVPYEAEVTTVIYYAAAVEGLEE